MPLFSGVEVFLLAATPRPNENVWRRRRTKDNTTAFCPSTQVHLVIKHNCVYRNPVTSLLLSLGVKQPITAFWSRPSVARLAARGRREGLSRTKFKSKTNRGSKNHRIYICMFCLSTAAKHVRSRRDQNYSFEATGCGKVLLPMIPVMYA